MLYRMMITVQLIGQWLQIFKLEHNKPSRNLLNLNESSVKYSSITTSNTYYAY